MDTMAPVLNAEIVYPTNDEWTYNNKKVVAFAVPPTYPSKLEIWFRTNSRPTENTYILLNEVTGDTLKKFIGATANLLHKDTFDLSPGNYSFQVFDIYGDGMSDFPLGQGDGVIQVRKFVGASTVTYLSMEKDFGTKNTRNFTVGYRTGYGDDYPACAAIDHTNVNDLTALDKLITIYPNPASNQLFLDCTLPQSSDIIVTIANVLGQDILRKEFKKVNQIDNLVLDINTLKDGIYLVKVSNGSKSFTQKVIVNK